MKSTPRLLIIGLDAATWAVIEPLLDGNLPTMRRLVAEGTRAVLMSTVPPVSPAAWGSIYTGVGPQSHGVFDFYQLLRGSYERVPTSPSYLRNRTVWELLESQGARVGLVSMPCTYPPPQLDGFVVADPEVPVGERMCWPRSLYAELVHAVAKASLEARPPVARPDGSYDVRRLDQYFTALEQVTTHLLRTQSVDCLAVGISALDVVQHFFYSDDPDRRAAGGVRDMVQYAYEQADRLLGDILEAVGNETTVLLLSDHGAGPMVGRINLDAWLANEGLLQFAETCPPLSAFRMRAGGLAAVGKALLRPVAERLAPRWLDARRRRVVSAVLNVGVGAIDWEHTRVFSWGTYPHFQVNVRRREPQGVVEPPDTRGVVDQLVARLQALTCPTAGRPVFSDVEAVPEGPRGPGPLATPDVAAHSDLYETVLRVPHPEAPLFLDDAFAARLDPVAQHRVANHRLEGVLLARGDGIKAGADIGRLSLLDAAPTILHLMGLPVPEAMDGHVATQMLEGDFLQARPPAYSGIDIAKEPIPPPGPYTEEEEAAVRERLRALGYGD